MNIPSQQEAQIRFSSIYRASVIRAAIRVHILTTSAPKSHELRHPPSSSTSAGSNYPHHRLNYHQTRSRMRSDIAYSLITGFRIWEILWRSRQRTGEFSHRLPLEREPQCIMNNTVEQRISESRVLNLLMPLIHRDLSGE
jgi:hypothetical protein